MAWNEYFELRWTSGGQVITRYYRLQLADNSHAAVKNLTGYATNLLGQLMRMRVNFRPRNPAGVIRVSGLNNEVAPWGKLSELAEAAVALDLEAKLWTDASFWKAEWTSDWLPNHYDPMGRWWYIPMELRQRE